MAKLITFARLPAVVVGKCLESEADRATPPSKRAVLLVKVAHVALPSKQATLSVMDDRKVLLGKQAVLSVMDDHVVLLERLVAM